ncbi:MAG: hypothetical protein KF861_18075, partial [Planctomycetaceae bacterium]|nr:hypothetical protein [Planctomycetaceae bacterium]
MLLSSVTWTGGGDGQLWSDPDNWNREGSAQLPQNGDDVIIPDIGEVGVSGDVTIVFDIDSVELNSLISAETLSVPSGFITVNSTSQFDGTLSVSGGTAVLSGDSQLSTLELTSSGTLDGTGDVTVGDLFTWTGGTLTGTGQLILPATASGLLSDASFNYLFLGRTFENAGTVEYQTEFGFGLLFGPDEDHAGIFRNLAGATFAASGEADIHHWYAPEDNRFENAGTFTRSGEGTTTVAVPFQNTGIMRVIDGNLELLNGGALQFSGTHYFALPATSTVTLENVDFGGSTNNVDLFSVPGTVHLRGSGEFPQVFEVMGRNLGDVPQGFQRNFALGTLIVEGHVQLVDQHDNSPGSGTEALYVDTLIVSAGATLDLNLLHIYARAVFIEGSVIGGTINALPDGGAIVLNRTVSGAIAVESEVDEWTFFGRAGQGVTVIANPGDASNPPPHNPVLGRIAVELVAPNGTVIASGASTEDGEVTTLLGVELASDGIYKVRVQAAAGSATGRGNYLLGVWNATVDTLPLVLNQ